MSLSYALKGDVLSVGLLDRETKLPVWKTMHSSHPSFKSIVRSLRKGDDAKALRLFDTAQLIADKSQGRVQVKKDGVYYNGTLIHNSLTKRILQLLREGKPVSRMLKFMDRLQENPVPSAREELYDWLDGCKLPITDDGRFVAYKRVRSDYKDVHSGTVDYSVGQVVFMQRSDVDPVRSNTCSRGLHFCSLAYLPSYPGDRIMQVVIDPADVVSIPNDYQYTKGRTWQMEVVKEIPRDQITELLDHGVDIDDYRVSVYSVSSDRKKLLTTVLALPLVKAMVRKAKNVKKVKRGRKSKDAAFVVSEQNIRKMTIGRLGELYKMYAPPEPTNIGQGAFYDPMLETNRLFAMRKAYGLSRGQVAAKMGVSYGTVANYEKAKHLPQATIDAYLDAVMKLNRLGDTAATGLSYPKPTQKRRAAAAAAGAEDAPVAAIADADDATDDEFGYEVEDEADLD